MKIVVKIGSAVLAGERGINKKVLLSVVDQVAELLEAGHQVVVVTSGAVASTPNGNYSRSLRAAIGQPKLMKLYYDFFDNHSIEACQLLYIYDDLDGQRKKYTKKLILEALKNKVVPVINANDSVTSDELDALKEFSDNDVLAAKVAEMIGADVVFILIKEAGLMDFNQNQVVSVVSNLKKVSQLVQKKSSVGTGGMKSKLNVAATLGKKGIELRLIPGNEKNSIIDSLNGKKVGTIFKL